MKDLLILSVLFLIIVHPFPARSDQWKLFEHRYDYKPEDVLEASKFVEKKGYWEGYRDNTLVGYVFLSKDWTSKLVGYSGKHLETLVGMDTGGTITGVKVLFHSEPIVLIGLKEENYQNFIKQYRGKDIKSHMSVGKEISMDAITGATVTAVVQNSIILESARKVAEEAGLLRIAKGKTRKISGRYERLTWDDLAGSGAVRNIKVTNKQLGMEGNEEYIDLYIAVITPPSIGRNLLGNSMYKEVMDGLKTGESALAIFSRGKGSFKGSGFARGGTFDRFNIEQGTKVYLFTEKEYRVLSSLGAEGAPDIREGGIIIVRERDFDPSSSFTLNLLMPYRLTAAKKEFQSFSIEYSIPERFLE